MSEMTKQELIQACRSASKHYDRLWQEDLKVQPPIPLGENVNGKNCDNCRYFEPIKMGRDLGECLRRCPQVAPNGNTIAQWPIIHASSWCGEHVPKVEEKAEGAYRDQ